MTELVPASELMAKRVGSVNPSNHHEEVFDLFSIPAYDSGQPDIVKGSEIGSSKKNVEPNDVLISRIVPHIRRCWVVPKASTRRQIASGEWITFRSDRFYPNYLRHYLMSDGFHKQFMQTVSGVGGSLLRARPAQVEKIKIPLPPIKEQKRIAAILDKADAIRRKRQQAIQLADEFLRSVFLDMFGDPVINPKNWATVSIGDFTSDWRGGASFKPDDFTDEGFPVLHKGAIQKGGRLVIDAGKKTRTTEAYADAHPKSVIDRSYMAVTLRDLVPTGPSIGLMSDLSMAPESKYILAQGAYGFRVNESKAKASYLVYLSNNPSFRKWLKKYSVGSTQIHIRTPIFKEIKIALPDFELQKSFDAIVHKIVRQNRSNTYFYNESLRFFSALQQHAFRGEL